MPPPQEDTTTNNTSSSHERILQVATALFAKHGYHGTTMRAIAKAAGLTISTVHYHIESKDKLYREVFRRQFEVEYNRFARVIGDAGDEVIYDPAAFRELAKNLMNVFTHRALEAPESVRLWVNHWLERSEPEFKPDVEMSAEFSFPIFQMAIDQFERARQAGTIHIEKINFQMFIAGFIWINTGFFAGRSINVDGSRIDHTDPQILAIFDEFLNHYLDSMLNFREKSK